MNLIGLTGGIGMGKSVSASFLEQRGFLIVDTDILARQLVEPGQAALEEIRGEFGAQLLDSDGMLLRDELARIVFGDSSSLKKLESILHPRIRKMWRVEAEKWRDQNRKGVVVIPLLFETAAQEEFDFILCVACSRQTQQRRLGERGWNNEQIQQRINSQWPIEKKITAADAVIWTDTTLDLHAAQLERILAKNAGA